jgi:hypothetical protein
LQSFTARFKHSGQNIALMSTAGNFTIEKVIKGSVGMWFNEYVHANMSHMEIYGTPAKG